MTLWELAECMSGCKTWSEVCKWSVAFQCPSTTQCFCVPSFWYWKWKMGEEKAKMCLCATVNLVQRCSPLAQPPICLYWISLLTEMAVGYVWHIFLWVQPSLLTSQSGSILYARACEGSTQKGAQHRECAWEPITRHCLVQLHWRGQLTNCAVASVILTCPQNFHYWAHALQYHAKFVGKTFLALKNMFQSFWFPFAALPKKACPGSIYFQVKRQLS